MNCEFLSTGAGVVGIGWEDTRGVAPTTPSPPGAPVTLGVARGVCCEGKKGRGVFCGTCVVRSGVWC